MQASVSRRFALLTLLSSSLAPARAHAAPDELLLGAKQGYPVGNAQNWFFNEAVRVGSFSHQGEIPGVFNGQVRELPAAASPMVLRKASREPAYRWSLEGRGAQTVDDYLNRQRVMGLLVLKDGVVQLERYQYERQPSHRFVSHSMAKSIVSLGIGLALEEGRIASLDDRAERYAVGLRGTLYGQTKLRNLLRMASGARFAERYDGADDFSRFGRAAAREGVESAAAGISERLAPEGSRFNYSSAEASMLAAVLYSAVGGSLSAYMGRRLWQPMGAETSALWHTDRAGVEAGAGHFNATLRDYARLGSLLAHDGRRPDTGAQIVPTDYLIEATDARLHAPPFLPGQAHSYFGFGYQFWTFPGKVRRFAMLGVYGQCIFVDPQLKLVMVQAAADASPMGESLNAESEALWRGLVTHYGAW